LTKDKQWYIIKRQGYGADAISKPTFYQYRSSVNDGFNHVDRLDLPYLDTLSVGVRRFSRAIGNATFIYPKLGTIKGNIIVMASRSKYMMELLTTQYDASRPISPTVAVEDKAAFGFIWNWMNGIYGGSYQTSSIKEVWYYMNYFGIGLTTSIINANFMNLISGVGASFTRYLTTSVLNALPSLSVLVARSDVSTAPPLADAEKWSYDPSFEGRPRRIFTRPYYDYTILNVFNEANDGDLAIIGTAGVGYHVYRISNVTKKSFKVEDTSIYFTAEGDTRWRRSDTNESVSRVIFLRAPGAALPEWNG
jgi:hypothetical protein